MIELPKWPHMIVAGLPLTKEQTYEVMIRTSDFYFSNNDRCHWTEAAEDILYTGYIGKDSKQDKRKWAYEKYQSLRQIYYLSNERFTSSWVGGPKGWLNWDGTIGCCNYNIGKWPTVDEVYSEWVLIADTFPFIDLKCQLMSDESCEENTKPLVEYVIKNGLVNIYEEPLEKLVSNVPYVDPTEYFIANIDNWDNLQGCSLEVFKEALDTCIKCIGESK